MHDIHSLGITFTKNYSLEIFAYVRENNKDGRIKAVISLEFRERLLKQRKKKRS